MRFFQITILALGLSFGTTLFSPSEAQAGAKFSLIDSAPHNDRPMTIDIMGQLATNAVGIAVWFGFPIVPNGFITPWNDAFFIEAGGLTSMYWYTDFWGNTQTYYATSPMAGVRYNFYMNDDWTVFATLKSGYTVGLSNTNQWTGFTTAGSIGAYWNFTDGMALRIEQVSNNISTLGIQAGISLEF